MPTLTTSENPQKDSFGWVWVFEGLGKIGMNPAGGVVGLCGRPKPRRLHSLVLAAHRKEKPLKGGWIYTTSSFEGHALLCTLSLVGRSPALPASVSSAMQSYGEYL